MAGTLGGGVVLLAACISDKGVGLLNLANSFSNRWMQREKKLTVGRKVSDEDGLKSRCYQQSVSDGNSHLVYVQEAAQMHLMAAALVIVR